MTAKHILGYFVDKSLQVVELTAELTQPREGTQKMRNTQKHKTELKQTSKQP